MVKEVYFFTEMAYSDFPQDKAEELGYSALLFPNKYFEPKKAKGFYDWYFEEQHFATEVGFDGLMINEHRNNPQNMNPALNITGTVLATKTKRGKIALLGNVLPASEEPVRLAEEIAMMDVISGGRIISGFIRGVGYESLAANANPIYNRSRFQEAHDLIVKTWTTPGPFRWEGEHYHYRAVNPWVLPMQKPHPPIWIPGGSSPETVIWAAQHGYPYVNLGTPLEVAPDVQKLYTDTAAEVGYTAGPEHFGYCAQVCVADTDEKAYEEARHFYWQMGKVFSLVPGHWLQPPGYMTRAALASRQGDRKNSLAVFDYEGAQAANRIFTGNPDTVIEKLKYVVDVANPAYLILWAREGPMSHEVAMRCLELLGKEVIPAIKEYVPMSER
jgi:alkanesulfonate monooxygenase SsuD/methylene tetrahydromethanopterin reductase-like flavin-dependent oxidoreductase (luciferase family)